VNPDNRDQAPHTTDALFVLVYQELKRIAGHHLSVLGGRTTLSTTELVHEAFLKLARNKGESWEDRAHFFGAASRAMRQVLVDYARRRGAAKRGGSAELVSLGQAGGELEVQLDDIMALDQALEQLGAVDPRLRDVVELRFFGGLSQGEVAELLRLSPRTVERDWLKARLFLLRQLGPAT
jgi:RNA polymerase sigma factor (TIGR02999 family)